MFVEGYSLMVVHSENTFIYNYVVALNRHFVHCFDPSVIEKKVVYIPLMKERLSQLPPEQYGKTGRRPLRHSFGEIPLPLVVSESSV